MITKEMLIHKGLIEPKNRWYLEYTDSYCKLWSCGFFMVRLVNNKLQVFEKNTHELITVVKNEETLDKLISFSFS